QGAAASFLTLAAPSSSDTPPTFLLGEASAPAIDPRTVASRPDKPDLYWISPPLLAFGAASIPTSRGDFASIGASRAEPRWMAATQPVVIRGGQQGNVFPDASLVVPASPPAAMADTSDQQPRTSEPAEAPADALPAAPFKPAL